MLARWVPLADAVTFEEHIRGTSKRSVTPERPFGYRSLSVYHVSLSNAFHQACANHLVNAIAWRLAIEGGRTAMETLVLHNIQRGEAVEKCGKNSIKNEYFRILSIL